MKVFITILFYVIAFFVSLKVLRLLWYFFHHLSFFTEIKCRVKKMGGTVKLLHFPLRSFFSKYDGEDILIHLCGETTALKFFPYFLKGKNIILNDHEHMITQNNFILFGGGSGGTARPPIHDASAIHNAKSKKYSSVFSSSAEKKIMLFSPAPISIKGVQIGGSIILDNSVKNYHFKIWTAKGFLQKLERKSIYSSTK
ncbi:MAG: hypothetical protein J6K61_04430 [Clostridia bacterium]|nr:hypothetical protein [Clostridia bacterium]